MLNKCNARQTGTGPIAPAITKQVHGFTLVELLVTLSILLVTTMGVIVRYTHDGRATTDTDAQALTQLLADARLVASHLQTQVAVCLLQEDGTCKQGRGRSLTSFAPDRRENTVLARYTLVHPKSYVHIVASRNTARLQFSGDGSAHSFGSIYYCPTGAGTREAIRIILRRSGYSYRSTKLAPGRCLR